jgi:hypothetical protein
MAERFPRSYPLEQRKTQLLYPKQKVILVKDTLKVHSAEEKTDLLQTPISLAMLEHLRQWVGSCRAFGTRNETLESHVQNHVAVGAWKPHVRVRGITGTYITCITCEI